MGHADLVEDVQGNWWAVFLGVRLTEDGYSVLGRETFLAPVIWKDEWPYIDNNEGCVKLKMSVARLPAATPNATGVTVGEGRDDFAADHLGPEWIFVRNPAEGSYSLDEAPGSLTLHGQATGLGDAGRITFAGKRQQHKQASFTTCMSFAPTAEGEEAGLCARRDEDAHYEIGVLRSGNRNRVMVRLTIRGESQIVYGAETESERVLLRIEAAEDEYALSYSEDGENWSSIATGPARALSPEDFVNKMCFTGVVIGLYATGNGRLSGVPAHFDWFKYQAK